MRATIDQGTTQAEITLIPDTPEDAEALKIFAGMTVRPHMINCRGFDYMNPVVEFLVQPMPRGD